MRCSSPSPAGSAASAQVAHQNRTLLAAGTIAHSICEPVPQRQLVFTIPKRFRIYFRHDRSLLGDLARAAWETVLQFYRNERWREYIFPGMIIAIQTFGQLVHFHPHVHAIVTDGGFAPDGLIVCLPRIKAILATTDRCTTSVIGR